MNGTIIPSILTSASSSFAECAVNAIFRFFSQKSSITTLETTTTEIHRFVDDYLKEQYSNLVDYRYVNDNLYKFMLEFIEHIQPQLNITGNVVINLVVDDKGIDNLVSSFFEMPENKKWIEIELHRREKLQQKSDQIFSQETVDDLIRRANELDLHLDISNNCTPEKIQELLHIVEQYEELDKRRRRE